MAPSLLAWRPRGKDDGFNLVELIVAMMIIGVVLLLLVGVQISAAVSVTEARKLQQATAIANQAMEQMRSIPWNTLNRGMYSDFLAEAGGDDLVISGSTLDVDPDDTTNATAALRIASAGADQDPASLARPLINEGGSNKQVVKDPSGSGVEFTIKAYVFEPSGVPVDGVVGIAIVAEWEGRRGVARTVVWSEAYRGSGTGCGQSLDTQPFLAACQSFFDASSSSGNVIVGISAIDAPVDPAVTATTQPLIFPTVVSYPTTGYEYTLSMHTASAGASLRSQQVSYADALIEYGGTEWDDGDLTTDIPVSERVRGNAVYTVTATDDSTNPDVAADAPEISVVQPSDAEFEKGISDSSRPSFKIRSDAERMSTLMASTSVTSCLAGVPAGEPCARAYIKNNNTNQLTGSGYLLLTIDGQIFRLSRRLSNLTGSTTAGNTDEAWVARLASMQGSSEIGCTSIVGAGCVAAGATRTNAVLSIGVAVDQPWNEAGSGNGMVYIDAPSGYYNESARVERGAGPTQMSAIPVLSRNGRVNVWNGTGYTSYVITADTSAVWDSAQLTWTHGNYTINATSQVHVLPKVVTASPNPDGKCESQACTVSASVGSIVVVSTYYIQTGVASDAHYLVVTTEVNGASATAAYKAGPSVP